MRTADLHWHRGRRSRVTGVFVTATVLVCALLVISIGGCGDSSPTAPDNYTMTVTVQPELRTVAAGDSLTVEFVVRAVTNGTLPLSLNVAFEGPPGVTPRYRPCASYGPKWAWLLAVGYGDFAVCTPTIVVASTVTPGLHTLTVVATAKGFNDARATIPLTVIAAR